MEAGGPPGLVLGAGSERGRVSLVLSQGLEADPFLLALEAVVDLEGHGPQGGGIDPAA